MNKAVIITLSVIVLALGAATESMQQTALAIGTTADRPDPNSFQNQGNIPPADAKASGADSTRQSGDR